MPGWGIPLFVAMGGTANPLRTSTVRSFFSADFLDSVSTDTFTVGGGGNMIKAYRPNCLSTLKGTFDGAQTLYITAFASSLVQPQIAFKLDGVFQSDIIPTVNNAFFNTSISAGAGSHTYEFWQSQQVLSGSTANGAWICGLQGSGLTVSTAQTASRCLVMLGDSIAGGGNTASPSRTGYLAQVKGDYPGRVVNLGYGTGSLCDKSAATWSSMVDSAIALSGATTIDVIIQFGTNDYGVLGVSSATYGTRLGATCDAINTAHPTARIFVQEILSRGDEPTLNSAGEFVTAYRAQQATVTSARPSFTTLVAKTAAGLSAVPGVNWQDNVHPNESGHNLLYTSNKSFLGY